MNKREYDERCRLAKAELNAEVERFEEKGLSDGDGYSKADLAVEIYDKYDVGPYNLRREDLED